jgi:GT2 family glycosyltransferase
LSDPQPFVVAVILNWNGLDDTRECLESLREVPYPNLRIVVLDNGSEADEAGALEREFTGFIDVVRNKRNLGFGGGANIGIRRALELGAEYVLLLNNDVTVAPDFLSELVGFASAWGNLAAVCPKAYFADRPDTLYSTGGKASVWTGVARQIGRGELDTGSYDRPAMVDYADGLCMLIPASALRVVGLLDEDYFAYWEETDWCFRAREAGLRCYYAPSARVWHKAARSQEASGGYNFRYRRNSLMFVRKRGGTVHFLVALLIQAFVYAPVYFIRHPRRIGRALSELRAVIWHASNRVRRRPLL